MVPTTSTPRPASKAKKVASKRLLSDDEYEEDDHDEPEVEFQSSVIEAVEVIKKASKPLSKKPRLASAARVITNKDPSVTIMGPKADED